MHIVFLDTLSLGSDIDLSPLTADGNTWTLYATSDAAEVIERVRDADIIVSNKVPIDRHAINAATRLKYIAVPATGTNNICLKSARERNIPVGNCSGYGTASVSQHVFALILSLATKISEYQKESMDGTWAKSAQFCLMDHPVMELKGKTLGIIGYGELGKAVARLAEAFEMQVLIANRPGLDTLSPGRFWLEELLPKVDVLSLHCPLSPETENLIAANEFKLMQNHALLINCARGGIVNETDLAQALLNADIGGAGVDVLTEEPPRDGNILLDTSLPNLIVTPHSAWISREARQRIVELTAKNITGFINDNHV